MLLQCSHIPLQCPQSNPVELTTSQLAWTIQAFNFQHEVKWCRFASSELSFYVCVCQFLFVCGVNDKGFLLHYFRFSQPRPKRAGVRDLRRWGLTSAAAAVIVRLPRAVSFGPIKPCKMNKLSYQLISKIIARYIQNNPEHSLHFAIACHFEPLVVTKKNWRFGTQHCQWNVACTASSEPFK